jgi:YfiH family protein
MSHIVPSWNVADNVCAISSTRKGGVSSAPFHSLNLGMHVGDNADHVGQNREYLAQSAGMPNQPIWLNQTHSNKVVVVDKPTNEVIDADALFTKAPNVVLSAMTADCLPILLTDTQGTAIAAVHAGWKGLANGIVENTLALFDSPVHAWIGPAIGPKHFEVGQDVYQAFCESMPQAAVAFNALPKKGKWLADLALIAELRMRLAGVMVITQSNRCTYSESDNFFSYRRENMTGRMASFIWRT